MACPYFFPFERIENSGFTVPPRLPLGDAYSGECRADATAHTPAEALLGRACNGGYGRAVCDRFPIDACGDAVRFHLSGSEGRTLRVQYVIEKDCWPATHGVLTYCESEGRFMDLHANAVLQRQAEAFVESYLRRLQGSTLSYGG